MSDQPTTADQLAQARAELAAAWTRIAAAEQIMQEAATYIMRRSERALYSELGNLSHDDAAELLARTTPVIVERLRAAARGE